MTFAPVDLQESRAYDLRLIDAADLGGNTLDGDFNYRYLTVDNSAPTFTDLLVGGQAARIAVTQGTSLAITAQVSDSLDGIALNGVEEGVIAQRVQFWLDVDGDLNSDNDKLFIAYADSVNAGVATLVTSAIPESGTLVAYASDRSGNVRDSSDDGFGVAVVINDVVAPGVSFAALGAQTELETFDLTANVTQGSDPVNYVSLRVDGVERGRVNGNGSTADFTGIVVPEHTAGTTSFELSAVAVDILGNSSPPFTQVVQISQEAVAPIVTVISPSEGQNFTLGTTFEVRVEASDNKNVERVDIALRDALDVAPDLVNVSLTAPVTGDTYVYSIDSETFIDTEVTAFHLDVTVFDAAGNPGGVGLLERVNLTSLRDTESPAGTLIVSADQVYPDEPLSTIDLSFTDTVSVKTVSLKLYDAFDNLLDTLLDAAPDSPVVTEEITGYVLPTAPGTYTLRAEAQDVLNPPTVLSESIEVVAVSAPEFSLSATETYDTVQRLDMTLSQQFTTADVSMAINLPASGNFQLTLTNNSPKLDIERIDFALGGSATFDTLNGATSDPDLFFNGDAYRSSAIGVSLDSLLTAGASLASITGNIDETVSSIDAVVRFSNGQSLAGSFIQDNSDAALWSFSESEDVPEHGVYYTRDDSIPDPGETGTFLYDGTPVLLPTGGRSAGLYTVTAFSLADGLYPSQVVSETYTFIAGLPTLVEVATVSGATTAVEGTDVALRITAEDVGGLDLLQLFRDGGAVLSENVSGIASQTYTVLTTLPEVSGDTSFDFTARVTDADTNQLNSAPLAFLVQDNLDPTIQNLAISGDTDGDGYYLEQDVITVAVDVADDWELATVEIRFDTDYDSQLETVGYTESDGRYTATILLPDLDPAVEALWTTPIEIHAQDIYGRSTLFSESITVRADTAPAISGDSLLTATVFDGFEAQIAIDIVDDNSPNFSVDDFSVTLNANPVAVTNLEIAGEQYTLTLDIAESGVDLPLVIEVADGLANVSRLETTLTVQPNTAPSVPEITYPDLATLIQNQLDIDWNASTDTEQSEAELLYLFDYRIDGTPDWIVIADAIDEVKTTGGLGAITTFLTDLPLNTDIHLRVAALDGALTSAYAELGPIRVRSFTLVAEWIDPVELTAFKEGDDLTLIVNVTQNDAPVTQVEFFYNGQSAGVDTTGSGGQYSITFRIPELQSAGDELILIHAVVTDDVGQNADAGNRSINVIQNQAPTPPVILSPVAQ